ncbi:Coenzyme A biosynthesis bifunctional protein CoaBC [Commensalibacter sp. Nvir]|uniref:bifunctional phosphopantothenoylcysteine decarboxylase/phosphopantothenate--cysteine ligase CoaBC n=1 Tax=Commensalibacter sp. Nvir TaxID=3069817 RepID=UPI002D62C444|nr:Coenzyme A biosynthesis bifunctional protein CoaBC [Commensalibacter sp. Nvir]
MSKHILLIVSGGIAAYKSLELIRLCKKNDFSVTCVLTKGGEQFVTPLSLQTLSGKKVHQDLFSLDSESTIDHITLSRKTDIIVIYPASANLIAKLAYGMADDLASTLLLAKPSTTPLYIAPAMNNKMWENEATQRNIICLKNAGIHFIGPDSGDLACGEQGLGKLSSPETVIKNIKFAFANTGVLSGKKALVTAGPTYEPIDPVRFIGNRSSGRQGYAIAEYLQKAGAEVTLISGPVNLSPPNGVAVIPVNTADEMLSTCSKVLPVDIAVMTAAVSDWKIKNYSSKKIKKDFNNPPPALELTPNKDILAWISSETLERPRLVVGFAAETHDIIENAKAKRERKKCDWIIVNDVKENTKIMGGVENEVTIITSSGMQHLCRADKKHIGRLITQEIINFFA